MAFLSVDIKSMLPYPVWTAIHRTVSYADSESERRFVVEFQVVGVPGWWQYNDVDRIFSLREENGAWRIYGQSGITDKSPEIRLVKLDPALFDGIILITKYYTYLDLSLLKKPKIC